MAHNPTLYMPFIFGVLGFLLVAAGPSHFPYLGVSIMLCAAIIAAYITRPVRTILLNAYLMFGLAFSLLIFIRAGGMFQILSIVNVILVAYIYSFMMFDHKASDKYSIITYISAPILSFFQFVQRILKIKFGHWVEKHTELTGIFSIKLWAQIAISLVVFALVAPILASTNFFFNNLITSFLGMLDLSVIIKLLLGDTLPDAVIRVFVFTFFYAISWFVYNYRQKQVVVFLEQNSFTTAYFTIPRIVLALTLIIYFITEIQLYFATTETLKLAGFSNSMQTREIFAQLAVVCLIVFALIYAQGKSLRHHKIITSILIVEALFLNTIALSSDLSYINNWGFTHKRLYGIAFVVWIYGVFIIFILPFIKKYKYSIARFGVFWTLTVALLVNIVNFDYIIYNFAPATEKGVDHDYLSRYVGFDSTKHKEHLLELYSKNINNCSEKNGDEARKIYFALDSAYLEAVNLIEIVDKYSDFKDLRIFNFAEYLNFRNAKDLKLIQIQDEILTCQNQLDTVL